ncbi:MAG: hypothetical protein J5716_07275 [Alphaproteobacteria bacterium]|nr:hypothetical protein [Alphaproteobacteria bacterium]
MFLFSNPFYAYRLYAFSRRLAEFRSEAVLNDLPLRFLTRRAGRKIAPDLPEEKEKRLALFLSRYGVPEQTLAAYLAFYPEITGNDLAELLLRSVWKLPDFPEQIKEADQKRADELLKLFYTLCLRQNKTKFFAEKFERLLNGELDFRLEASMLERLRDAFYEEETVQTVLPDWPGTAKSRLTLEKSGKLFPLRESPDKQKTATALARAVVSMLFRDGFLIIPSNACCRTDDKGTLYFIRARLPLILTDKERGFISSFAESIFAKKYQAAANAFLAGGYATGSALALTKLIEKTDEETKPFTLAQKAEFLLNELHANGFPLPFFMRYCVQALKATELLCRQELCFNQDFWTAAATDFSDFLLSGKNIRSNLQETAAQFRQAFSFAPHQEERLTVQSRKPPAFQKDTDKLSEILSKQTVASQFQRKKRRILPLLLLFAALGALIGLLLNVY